MLADAKEELNLLAGNAESAVSTFVYLSSFAGYRVFEWIQRVLMVTTNVGVELVVLSVNI